MNSEQKHTVDFEQHETFEIMVTHRWHPPQAIIIAVMVMIFILLAGCNGDGSMYETPGMIKAREDAAETMKLKKQLIECESDLEGFAEQSEELDTLLRMLPDKANNKETVDKILAAKENTSKLQSLTKTKIKRAKLRLVELGETVE